MADQDPLSKLGPQNLGYGHSGSKPFNANNSVNYSENAHRLITKILAEHSTETSNLTRENLECIMGHIGDIVSQKVDKYSPLDRYDKEHFLHALEQERLHGKLSPDDIKHAWQIWDNFAK